VLTGCTSVVAGRGHAAHSSSTPTGSSGPTKSPSASSASTSASLPRDLLRSPAATAIGDPPTADLCAATGLGVLQGLGGGLTPAFDGRQYPPGCSITLRDGQTPVLSVSVFGEAGTPDAQHGRTTRTAAGQTIYMYPFDTSTGDCRRELAPTGVRLTIDAAPQGGTTPDRGLDCAATDALADRWAEVVAQGQVPRLHLADPSLAQLHACAVVRKAGLSGLSAFAGAQLSDEGFDTSCEVHRGSLFLFFNFVVAAAPHPATATPDVVDGHQLYAVSTQPTFCSYESTQGRTADGRYEQVAASATGASGHVPADLCDQTAQALARYLGAAGLS
jgi:type 1 fimbria pilin